MPSRYSDRLKMKNGSTLYEDMLEERGLSYIRHFTTPELKYPTARQLAEIKRVAHLWKRGDRLYKLAHEHYGDSRLWWIIAWFNRKPTESHIKIGEVIFVPKPLSTITKYLRG